MDDKNEYDLKNLAKGKDRDFSHSSHGPMKGVKLENWAIFYSNFGEREFNTFVKELQTTVK